MNRKEVKKAFLQFKADNALSSSELAWNDLEQTTRDALTAELGAYELVLTGERTEGSGDFDGAETIYHFKDHNTYICLSGYYSSDGGCDFGSADIFLVEPVQVTRTEYHGVKE